MPGRLDETRPFLPVNVALLTVSDTRDAAQDRSGNTLAELAGAAGHRIVVRRIVRDEHDQIAAQLRAWIADPDIDVVISTGGTAAGALLPQGQGITRLRGRWFDLAVPGLDQPVPTLPMFHPSFLLRTPERKREAWRDLLSLRARLDELLSAEGAG